MDRLASVPLLLTAFESRYRADHRHEHALLLDAQGNIVAQNTGDYDSVHFVNNDLETARGGFVTHSHPRALPPSGPDLMLSARYNLLLRAVGNAPDTKQRFDYTVRARLPEAIAAHFDDEVEQAEKELSRRPYGDLQWQRESRHLAVKRLAETLGFPYQRVQKNVSLAEAATHENARLNLLANVDSTLAREVFVPLVSDLSRTLLKASVHGMVPITSLSAVRARMNALVQKTFFASLPDGTLTLYSIQRGRLVPRSVYFATLLSLLHNAAALAVEHHAAIMRKYLPPDLIRAFSYATVMPQELSETRPQYDPLHRWIGPDGKRLSDRIWNAAGDMRRKLDQYLTQAIARQLPVEQIASGLEIYLVNGAGSYEALRLARTEVSAAHSRAGYQAARRNPFIEKYQPFTAPSHQCSDQCDVEEANGPYDLSDPSHLPPFHPNCIDGVRWIRVDDVKGVIRGLRRQIDDAITAARTAVTDVLNPLSPAFVDWLFKG